jgi:enediyne biosynthesis protein E7
MRKVPTEIRCAPRLPLVGSLLHLRYARSDFLLDTARSLGDAYWLDLGADRVLVVGHPNDAARVLENYHLYPDKGGNTGFRRVSVPFLGAGLSTWNGMDAEWRRRRSGFSSVYRATAHMGVLEVESLEGTGADVLRELLERRLVADLVYANLGHEPPDEEIAAAVRVLRMLVGSFWVSKYPGFHPFVRSRTRRAVEVLQSLAQRWLDCGAAKAEESPVRQPVDRLTAQQARDEVLSQLLSVGTLVVPALWGLYLLAAHPHVQSKLRALVGSSCDDEYLTWVIHEILRLCPSTYWIQRRAETQDELNGVRIEPETRIVVLVPRVHRHPDFWDAPDQFRPERFGEGQHWKKAWMPFGHGPRLCVARTYSLNWLKAIIVFVLQKYRVELTSRSRTQLVPEFSLVPRPTPGLVFSRVLPAR